MPEDATTKVCPLCAETIKAAAKVCPHCRKWQCRGLMLNRFDLTALGTLILLGVTFVVVSNMLTEPRKFSAHKDDLEILTSRVTPAPKNTNYIFITGVLTNRGKYPWIVGKFEIRFFDRSGRLTNAGAGWTDENFTVPPHSDHAFRFEVQQTELKFQEAGYKLSVSGAIDPRQTVLK